MTAPPPDTPDLGGSHRRRPDDLPPYAPRPAAADEPPAAAPAPDADPPAPALDAEQAEEAAAFAEAREQGLDDVVWDPPPDPAADTVEPLPADLEAVPGDGAEQHPATAELPLPDVSEEPAAGTAPTDSAIPGPDLPDADLPAALQAGEEREQAHETRQQEAAAALATDPARSGHEPAPRLRFREEPVRWVVRGIGELLITAGLLLGLFVVYEVYVTDLLGAQKQEVAREQMEDRWATAETTTSADTSATAAAPAAADQVVDPAQRERRYTTATGEGFANIYIPVFGADYIFAVVEGTTTEDLYGNPGHYDDTQYPGELGNFAVAGHRVSKGSPFNALDTLNACDAIVIETQDDWFVYRVLPMADEADGWNAAGQPKCTGVAPLTGEYAGVPGREIVDPSDYAQVLPIPHLDQVGPAALAAATERLITLTTCHPQFSDAERMIVHGVLTQTYAKAPGFVPPELGES